MRLLVVWLATFCRRQAMTPAYSYARRSAVAVLPAFLLAMCWSTLSVHGQVPSSLGSVGLEQLWQGQVQMPVGRGSIVSAQVWNSTNLKRQYAELTFSLDGGQGLGGSRTIRVSADKLGADGKPVGFEVAKKEAEIIASRLLGRSPAVAAVEVVSPIVFLIVTTSDGTIQTFDGESGQLLWANGAGASHQPTAPASISDDGVAVVHGLSIELFDLMTGKLIGSRPLKYATANGVALVGTHAFVPSITGQVTSYDFAAAVNKEPWVQLIRGQPVGIPVGLQSPSKIAAVATNLGDITVFAVTDGVESWYCYRGKNPVIGPLSYCGNGLYAGDSLGQIVKIGADREGHPHWRLQIGQTLASPVIAVNNRAYIVTEGGSMFSVDDTEGDYVWEQPTQRIRDVLSVSDTRLYCRSLTDRLLVVDVKTGKIVGETGPSVIGTTVQNTLSDRVYLISQSGRIQAMREMGAAHALPKFHKPIQLTPAGGTKPPAAQPNMPAAPAPGEDPFGGAGTATPPPTPGTDPFGSDPFNAGGAGGAAPSTDPSPF